MHIKWLFVFIILLLENLFHDYVLIVSSFSFLYIAINNVLTSLNSTYYVCTIFIFIYTTHIIVQQYIVDQA